MPQPLIAKLIASVAPEVKITRPSLGKSAATCSRATSTAAAACRPPACALCGFQYLSFSQGSIAAKALGASGVVA
jgi:hypothetical protein